MQKSIFVCFQKKRGCIYQSILFPFPFWDSILTRKLNLVKNLNIEVSLDLKYVWNSIGNTNNPKKSYKPKALAFYKWDTFKKKLNLSPFTPQKLSLIKSFGSLAEKLRVVVFFVWFSVIALFLEYKTNHWELVNFFNIVFL